MELIVTVVGMCIAFMLGASTKEKKIIIPNPVKAVENKIVEKKTQKEIEKQDEIYKTIAANIDNYDGTGNGQQDIPR